jgi:hypothetical protein
MRLRLTDLALPLVALAAVLSACGGSSGRELPLAAVAETELTGARAHAPARATAGTLSRIPDSDATRRRLGYVNVAALRAQPQLDRAAVIAAVLGDLDPGDHADAVRTGDELARPADRAPQTSAITPNAQSAAQSCLGDTLAQTTIGMGRDAALGAGIAVAGDTPSGLQLRVCGAAHYVRDLHAMERNATRALPNATVRENEIGEREIVAATVDLDDVDERTVLALLRGGPTLRAAGWSKKATSP